MDKAVQNEMLTELLSQIDEASDTEMQVLKTKNRFLHRIGRYAAVACIILAVGSGAYYTGVSRTADDTNKEVTMSVSNGQKADIVLADGTKVYINSDSRIVYSNSYNKKHVLFLWKEKPILKLQRIRKTFHRKSKWHQCTSVRYKLQYTCT